MDNQRNSDDFEECINKIKLLYGNRDAIIEYLKNLTDIIQKYQLECCLNKKNDDIPNHLDYVNAFGKKYDSDDRFVTNFKIEVDLSKAPLISSIWRRASLDNALKTIGDGCHFVGDKKENIFKYDSINHEVIHIYPLGINVVSNGFHSIYSGMVKRKGIVMVTKIIDITKSFSTIQYNSNGVLINGESNSDIPLQNIKEIAIIYEIGRLMLESKQEYIYPKISEYRNYYWKEGE